MIKLDETIGSNSSSGFPAFMNGKTCLRATALVIDGNVPYTRQLAKACNGEDI